MSVNIYENSALKRVDGMPVDGALSGTSTNPVQNKVVKEAIDELNYNIANISDIGKSLKSKDFQVSASSYYESNGVNSGTITLPSDCTTILAITVYTNEQNRFLCGVGISGSNWYWTAKNVYTSGLNTTVRVKLLYT